MPATSKRRQRIAPFTLLAILVAIFVALAIVLVSPKQPFDPDTLCPDDGDYPRTAVVIDATDPLSSSQAKAISEEISSLRRELAVNEWVGIFVLNEDNLTLPSPEIALCNPGDESTANPLYENPDQVRRRFERKFRKPMEQAVERLAQLPLSPTSPILEMIRAVALDRSFDSTKERRLIIISDMLHNVPAYSHYRESADFFRWRKTDYAQEFLQLSLLDVEVDVLYLKRADDTIRNIQTRRHVAFWEDYFEAVGASIRRLKPIL